MGSDDDLLAQAGMPPGSKMMEMDSAALEEAAERMAEEEGDDRPHVPFRDLLGPNCVIKRVDKDRKVLGHANPDDMEHEMMTKAAAQKRLGACAEHVKELSRPEKLSWALEMKDQANELFYKNLFEEASKLYNDCLVALDLDGTEEERQEVQEKLQLPICTNLAACMIEMGHYYRCIEICNIALSVDDSHPKALYRRGLSYYRQGNHALARPDFEAALQEVDGRALTKAMAESVGQSIEDEKKSLADLRRRIIVYLTHIRRFSVQEKQACKKMFQKDAAATELYAEKVDAKPEEEECFIDDSDEAIDAELARVKGDWSMCCCRRRAPPKEKES
eukprot:TRINITY_DN92613_c0_g1_i1.p1 TRINITY_DN92613_c0_g1~~TRINITY_DN92613_c0_g1_i1.p1  ORF type:complete len:333 (+),score=96.93 TRINITY_DN92613_c0_g1_i1:251-1249(+)